MIAAITIRPLRDTDTLRLAGVLERAYESNQDFASRLKAYLRRRSAATFVADLAGEPVGMVVGNDYGPVAYVSQMAVDPPQQRAGIGTALMDSLIAWADRRGFAAVELDATPKGAPLYARYGFVEAGQTLVYHAAFPGATPGAARPYTTADAGAIFAADARAFGANRSEVLQLLFESNDNLVFVTGRPGAANGYAVAQRNKELLGPVVAPSAAAAGRLIDAARVHLPAAQRISLPSENGAAQALVTARGYRFLRSLAHMIRGTRPPAARQTLFARINLGQG